MEKQLKELSGNIGDIFDVDIVRVDDGLSSIYRKEDVVIILNKLKEVVCKVIESSDDTFATANTNGSKLNLESIKNAILGEVDSIVRNVDVEEFVEFELYGREIQVDVNQRDLVSQIKDGLESAFDDFVAEQEEKEENQNA